MDREELHKSIQAYEEQLEQVKRTLEITGDDEERKSLESLKSDLVELIELTLQTIEQDETHYDSNEQHCESEFSESSSDKNTSLFVSRVKNLEEISLDVDQNHSISDEVYEQKLQNIKDELKNMIGEKCSAPHNHSWGSIVYHNAIICGLEESCDYELANFKNFRIRVLFTNPTHREMIPCPYFLEGECKFNADKCHFSHGELIAIGELKEYQTPDFTKLTRNCVVLAKLDDRMWHKGKVICSNFIEKSCRIRINGQRNEIDLKFEDLFPIFHENENSSSENDDHNSDDDSNDSSDSDSSEIRDKKIIERTLLNPISNQPLGDWEKHTRGIGSKLMKKMGYVFGAGLGSNGEGIVAPIIAQILPPGRSLDYCMELREMSSDGDNLFSLEKKMKKEQQKTERLNRNDDDSRKKKQQNGDDIFSFLNYNILSAGNLDMGGAGDKQNKISNNLNDFRNHSTKKLNIENVKIGDEIRKKEKEINKIKESMKRHSIGTDIYERLKIQFNCKNHELENLKQSECKLNKEQISRKKLDESFVF